MAQKRYTPLDRCDRKTLVQILEQNLGAAVYDDEPDEDLRESILESAEDLEGILFEESMSAEEYRAFHYYKNQEGYYPPSFVDFKGQSADRNEFYLEVAEELGLESKWHIYIDREKLTNDLSQDYTEVELDNGTVYFFY